MALEAPEPSGAPQPASAPTWIAADTTSDVGLAGIHAHLERVVARLGLRSLIVVVDDPDLGRQAFRAGSGQVGAGTVSAGTGVLADPATAAGDLDADLLVALCGASLRVDVLRDSAEAAGELVVRRLPGVFAVEIEDDDDLTICRVHVGDDAPVDIGRIAARALPATKTRLVVEVVTSSRVTAPDTAAAPTPAPVPSPADLPPPSPPEREPLLHTPAAAPVVADDDEPAAPELLTLLAVRSVPEDGEIEVHLSLAGARAVGRAPLSRGLAGAAEAVLAAAAQVTPGVPWRPSWVRTVETTADGRFVVASALVDPARSDHCHGIATGSSPIDAAARATVGALTSTASGQAP